jgi:hypothetical protein
MIGDGDVAQIPRGAPIERILWILEFASVPHSFYEQLGG